jgi:mRNA interferase HigB
VKRIVAKRTLVKFWEDYPDSKSYLETWYETASKAEWKTPNDIKSFYATVSILKNSRVVFNIKGNSYRLVAKINYVRSWMFIRFIGTHAEYDKIDANNI